MKNANGSYAEVSVTQNKDSIYLNIFATTSGKNGNFSGSGKRMGNVYTIKDKEQGTGCTIKLMYHSGHIDITCSDRFEQNLPEDFLRRYYPVRKEK